ncbi:MAG: MucBP domain-containing protein [Clostridia bacterium]|nr:MucBP domain-containing protein [Clostridia bacterium]
MKNRKKIYIGIILIFMFTLLGVNVIKDRMVGEEVFNETYQSLEPVIVTSDTGEEVVVGDVAKVTSLEITSILTGTSEFDSETTTDSSNADGTVTWTAGNDISENDMVVRSNDEVSYNLLATLGMKDPNSDIKSLYGGRIYFKCTIPEEQFNNAQFITSSFYWATSKTVSNSNRTVEGYYDLPTSTVSIPGQISLSFRVGTFGVENGTEITPQIDVWLDQNTDDEKVTYKSAPVYISSKSNFNARIVDGNKTQWSYQDLDGDGEAETLGKLYTLQYAVFTSNSDSENDSNSKKNLKGLKNPTGDINLNIDLSVNKVVAETGEGEDITERLTPILIDYNDDKADQITEKNGGDYERLSEYNIKKYTPGTQTVDMIDNMININVSGFKLPTEYYMYGHKNGCPFFNNVECNLILTEGNIEIFVPYDEELMENLTYNFYINSEIANMTVESYNNDTNQKYFKDDMISSQLVVVKGNNFNQTFDIAYNPSSSYNSSYSFYASDQPERIYDYYSKYSIGSSFIIGVDNFNTVKAATKFVKFDADAFEINATSSEKYITEDYDSSMTFNLYYVTKKDGTNWIDQTEMNNALIDDMNVYLNYEDIPEAYSCIGVYFESIEGELTGATDGEEWLGVPVLIKKDVEVEKYFTITGYTKVWFDEIDRNEKNILISKEAELPSPDWESGERYYTPHDNYSSLRDKNLTNNLTYDTSYGYNNGGCYYGETCYLLKSRNVSRRTYKYQTQHTSENSISKLDYSNNEYRLDMTLVLEATGRESSMGEFLDYDIQIQLGEGISYIEGSCSEMSEFYIGEPEVKISEDGYTYLRWYDVQISKELFSSSKSTTRYYTDDTYHYTLENQIAMSLEFDPTLKNNTTVPIRGNEMNYQSGMSGGSITVINLQQYSLYKKTTTSLIEKNGDIHYQIYFSNNTTATLPDFQLLDILPQTSDTRGSIFNGNYTIENISIAQNDADGNIVENSNLEVRVSNDEQVLNLNSKSEELKDDTIWTKIEEVDGTYSISLEEKAFNITGEILENGQLVIDVYLKTNGNKSSDVYYNMVTSQTLSENEQIESVNVETKVINRTLSGVAWIDIDKDGLLASNDTEPKKSGIKITLLDSSGNVALDSDGNEVASINTNIEGYYEFSNLAKTDYIVQAEYDNVKYYITLAEVVENSNYTSKFYDNQNNGIGTTNIITTLNGEGYSAQTQRNVNIGLATYDGKIIVNHIVKNDDSILETETIIEPLNTAVTTSSKKFDGYILVEKPSTEEYITLNTDQIVNYYYLLQGELVINKVDYKDEKIVMDSAQFEIYDENNNKIYFEKSLGINIHFASNFKFESINYDWIEIYYVKDGVTYRYQEDETYKFSNTDLADVTITLPSSEFYIWLRTDGSAMYRGFEIDSIKVEKQEVTRNDLETALPTDIKETLEYSGVTYPQSNDSATTYANNMRTLYHYIGNDGYVYAPGNQSLGFVETQNGIAKVYLPVGKYTIKEIKAPEGYVIKTKTTDVELSNDNTTEIDIKNDKTTSIVVKHQNEGGVDLVNPETINGKVGDLYTTASKEFLDYEIKTVPDNANGTMTENQIEVIYVYSQIKGKVTVTKVDISNTNTKLSGATFKIEKLDEDGNVDTTFTAQEKTTDTTGTVEFTDLLVGKYQIIETKAPEGYELNTEVTEVEITKANRELEVTVKNREKLTLPETGKINHAIIISTVGVVIMFVMFIILKNSKNKKENS